jgi:MOSC domain-containing protein YiiM
MKRGQVLAVCRSHSKGERKRNIGGGELLADWGLKDDAHAGGGHRQLSLLAKESIDKMVAMGLNVGPGDFAENLTTEGIELMSLPIGSRLRVGRTILLEITQIGKECHNRCSIYYQAGDCVMPKEGVFAVIKSGGTVAEGDPITIVSD